MIPASQIVDITPRVINGGLSGLSFVGALLSKNSALPANTAVSFTDASSVGEYFGTASNEYKLASVYFASDLNSNRKPERLYFYKKVDSAVAGWVRGVKVASLAGLQAISAGSLTIEIDGSGISISGIDLSAATSYSNVASIVQTALQSELASTTCVWDSSFQAFVITSPTTGATSSVSFASGDLASAMGLTTGAISAGSAAVDLAGTMDNLVKVQSNFWSFMPVWEETSTEALELAQWCNTQGVRFLYAMVDKDASAKTSGAVTLASQVKDMYGVTALYNTKELGAFVMGVGAGIDPNALEGRKTWAFTRGGISATCDDKNEAPILLENGYNFYGHYANAANDFNFLYNGSVSGNAKWLDTYYGQLFIKDGLQNAWLTAMINANTLPYNQAGYGVLSAAALDTINVAKNAGFIREGVALSNAQKAQVTQEAGLDISSALETQGWYLQILDPSASVREERGTPIVNFWYCDGGSVQRIQGTSTVLL